MAQEMHKNLQQKSHRAYKNLTFVFGLTSSFPYSDFFPFCSTKKGMYPLESMRKHDAQHDLGLVVNVLQA